MLFILFTSPVSGFSVVADRCVLTVETMISKCRMEMMHQRVRFFTPAEQEILMEGPEEFKSIICTEGDTAQAAKMRRKKRSAKSGRQLICVQLCAFINLQINV